MKFWLLTGFVVVLLRCSLPMPRAAAQDALPEDSPAAVPAPSAEAVPSDENSLEALEQTLVKLVRDSIPAKYVNTKQWGMTKDVFDGLKVEREGWKIETRRRRKPVNHGTWKRYEMTLIDPDKEFQLNLHEVTETMDGRYQFAVTCQARVHVFGRLSQWERGVQLISLNADADARVRLRITGILGMRLDPTRFPPDLSLDPRVTQASLELLDFRLNRLSELHGPLAKHLGEGLREILEDKLDETNRTLAAKLNHQIDKKRDKLRISPQELVTSKWNKWIKSAEPE